MDEKTIAMTWRKLMIPFGMGLLLLVVGILCHDLGSKRPGPQTLWLLLGLLGLFFAGFAGYKMLQFRKFLRSEGGQ